MVRVDSSFAIACAVVVTAGCSGGDSGPRIVAGIEFTNGTSYDIGQTFPNHRHEVRFPFINRGAEGFLVQRVASSCGCAKVEYPKHTIPAGEQGTITCIVNVGPGGRDRVDLAVFEKRAGGETSRIPLKITFSVFRLVEFEPRPLVLSGMRPGQELLDAFFVLVRSREDEETEKILMSVEIQHAGLSVHRGGSVRFVGGVRVSYGLKVSEKLSPDISGINTNVRALCRGRFVTLPVSIAIETQ